MTTNAKLFVRFVLSICVAACFSIEAFAQVTGDTIRIRTEMTSVEVLATGPDGKAVSGLTKADFEIYENGQKRDIEFFEPVRRQEQNRPLAIVFALDVSGSMTNEEIELLGASIRRFIARLEDPNAYFAILAFGMDVRTIQGFTNRRDKLEKSLRRLVDRDDGLSTHAYDATDFAIRMLDRKSPKSIAGKFPKRAVILITDGFPVGDTVEPQTVIERANRAETSVFSILMPSFSRLQGKKKPLPTLLETSGLIERTGGRSFYATQSNFDELFDGLAVEIVSSYVLAYYPPEETFGKPSREILVKSVKGLRIRQNRTSYRREK